MNTMLFIALLVLLALALVLLWVKRPKPARGPKTFEIRFVGLEFEVRDWDKPCETIGLWDNFHDSAAHACDLAREGDTIILPAGVFNIDAPITLGRGVTVVGGGPK